MELFDKKFVHFIWDDELKGKTGIVSNDIKCLRDYVNNKSFDTELIEHSNDESQPFKTTDGIKFRFAYYDPNYEAKRAFNEGKEIQVHCSNGTWRDCDKPKWYDDCAYRIKPEEKWIAYLVRKPLMGKSCYLTACRKDNWEKVQEEFGAKTQLFVGTESEAQQWYESRQKFAEVIKAWEDGKTIQYKALDTGRWCDFDPKLGPCLWNDTTKYRVKPEEKTVAAKVCSGCVHEHCSALREPCVSCKHGKSKYEAKLCETCEHLGYSDDSEPCSNCSDENGYPNWEPKKKEEKTWRPYESSAEMIMDFIDRFKVKCPSYCEPLIWVKGKENDNRFLVTGISPEFGACLDKDAYSSFNTLFNWYTYLDGSPCGMEVEE